MRKLILITTVSLLLSGCSTIGGWFSSAEQKREPSELKTLSATLPVRTLWSVDVGVGVGEEFFKLSPTLHQDVIYAVGREGRVSAINASTGGVKWSVDLDLPISAGAGVGDGIVLVGTDGAELVALSMIDGSEKWRTRASSGLLSAPAVKGGIAAVRTLDGNVSGYEVTAGGRNWVYPRRVPALTLRGTSAPIAYGDKVLSASDSGRLTLLDLRTGSPLWEKNIAAAKGRTELERIVDIDGDPVVIENTVYVVSFQGKVAGLNVHRGRAIWARDMSSYVGLDADSNQVYVTNDESDVLGLDSSSGESLWKQTDLHYRQLTRPVSVGSFVAVGDFEGYIHWLSKADGGIVARTQVDSSGVLASPVSDGNVLYVVDRGGRLSALSVSR